MKKIIIFHLFLLLACTAFSQKNFFPDDWLGIYSGEMYMLKSGSEKTDTVSLLFEFLETGKPKCWTYRMIYNNPKYGKIVKDYELLRPDSLPEAMFLLDEKDGIKIQMVKMGNSLYSNFSVAGQYLTSVMRKENNLLFYEIVLAKSEPSLIAKNYPEDKKETYTVQSYPPYTCQIARLTKIK